MRAKTIIRCRKNEVSGRWSAKRGKIPWLSHMTFSRLFRSLPNIIEDRDKVYAIDIIIRRK